MDVESLPLPRPIGQHIPAFSADRAIAGDFDQLAAYHAGRAVREIDAAFANMELVAADPVKHTAEW